MRTVNMPGGEIMPAAERGTIDCAEWVGGVEDMRFGFQDIWKWHYAPSLHESVTLGEVVINGDVWKEISPLDQEIIRAAAPRPCSNGGRGGRSRTPMPSWSCAKSTRSTYEQHRPRS